MAQAVVAVAALVALVAGWPAAHPHGRGGAGTRPPLPSSATSTRAPAPTPAPAATAAPVAVAEAFTRALLGGESGSPALATPALRAQLAGSPGSPALAAAARGAGQQREVGPVTAAVDDETPTAVGVSTSAVVRLVAGPRWTDITEFLDLLVVHTPAGWRVAEVQLG